MFCPVCNSEARIVAGLIVTIIDCDDTNVKWGGFVACSACSMVSEVQDELLVDWCDVPLEDLTLAHPINMFIVRTAASPTLHGRRDS